VVVSTFILAYEARSDIPASRSTLPPYSQNDPRFYLTGSRELTLPKIRAGKARLHAFADFVEEKSFGDETGSAWRRDMAGWFRGTQTASPDKVRRLSSALDDSSIRAFWESGYVQHLVVLMYHLVKRRAFQDAILLAAYTFRTWIGRNEDEQLALVDMFEPHGLFWQYLMLFERTDYFWASVPARVTIGDVEGDAWRAIFRLCDPADHEMMSDGERRYPCADVSAASLFLITKAPYAGESAFTPQFLIDALKRRIKQLERSAER
jgi:hypothetical protein